MLARKGAETSDQRLGNPLIAKIAFVLWKSLQWEVILLSGRLTKHLFGMVTGVSFKHL